MLKISNERPADDDLIANLLLINFYFFFNYLNALFHNVLLLATIQGLIYLNLFLKMTVSLRGKCYKLISRIKKMTLKSSR